MGYALNNYEPTVINSIAIDANSITKLKFSIIESSGNLTLNAWINGQLILTGDINNADERLLSGHLALGFERGNMVDGIIDNVYIDFNPYITDVKEIASLPEIFMLYQNYPNPFNPSTTIQYQIPKTDNVSLKVYDILGNEIAVLVNEIKTAGIYKSIFNSKNLSSGIYFYRLQTSSFSETKKLLLIK